MTLDQLRIFLAVAAREHVTAAAVAVNKTQSAVSAAISALEERHGVKLFDRIGRRIVLTEAGRLFRHEAAAVLKRADQAEDLLRDMAGGVAGSLRIGASQTVASYWLPRRLVRFRARFPAVTLYLQAGNTASVAKAVRDGSADLGIVEGRAGLEDLSAETIAEDHIVVVVGPRHPWLEKELVTLADLPRSAWVLREPGSGTRSEFEAHLRNMGLNLGDANIALEMPSNEACLAAVEAGPYATVLSRRAVPFHLQDRICATAFDLPKRDFAVVRDPRRHLSNAVAAMLDILRTGATDDG